AAAAGATVGVSGVRSSGLARPALFPYPTLFRSAEHGEVRHSDVGGNRERPRDASALRPEPTSQRQGAAQEDQQGHCPGPRLRDRSEEHTSELQSREKIVCRLLLGNKNAAATRRQ